MKIKNIQSKNLLSISSAFTSASEDVMVIVRGEGDFFGLDSTRLTPFDKRHTIKLDWINKSANQEGLKP